MRRVRIAVIILALASQLDASVKKYSGHGMVLSIDAARRNVVVSHQPIKGFMDAMVMPFTVRDPKLLEGVKPGHQIYFRVVVEKAASYIDLVRVTSADPVDPSKWQSPVVSNLVEVGQPVPDFQLTDHDGRTRRLSEFRGKVTVVTFIYTRCPLPEYCPRMTDNFADVKKRFGDRVGRDIVLLSITIDPQYDTPEILQTYAKVFGGGSDVGWFYLTGEKPLIQRVAGYFGLEFWPDEGQILHNLQTAIIDREGRMAANLEGKEYSARQLGDLIERVIGRGSN